MLQSVHAMTQAMSAYTALNVASVILMTLRVIKLLDFQPRLGLVTRTLAHAAVDLAHFFMVFMLVHSAYAMVGFISFGSSIAKMSSFAKASATLMEVLLGEVDVLTDLTRLANGTVAQCYFWSFILISFFILINVLLAILVDAYVEIKAEAENTTTVLNDLHNMMPKFGAARRRRMQMSAIVKELKAASERAAEQRRAQALAGGANSAQEQQNPAMATTSSSGGKMPKARPRVRVGRADIDEKVLARVLRRYGDVVAGVGTGDRQDMAKALELSRAMLHTLKDPVTDTAELAGAQMGAEGFQLFVLKEFQKIHSNQHDNELFQRRVLSKMGLKVPNNLSRGSFHRRRKTGPQLAMHSGQTNPVAFDADMAVHVTELHQNAHAQAQV